MFFQKVILFTMSTTNRISGSGQFSNSCYISYVSYSMIYKVECVFPMIIWPEFRMGQYRDDDHREQATHFNYDMIRLPWYNLKSLQSIWTTNLFLLFMLLNIVRGQPSLLSGCMTNRLMMIQITVLVTMRPIWNISIWSDVGMKPIVRKSIT